MNAIARLGLHFAVPVGESVFPNDMNPWGKVNLTQKA